MPGRTSVVTAVLLGVAVFLATGCAAPPDRGPAGRIDLAMLGPADGRHGDDRAVPSADAPPFISLGAGDALGESVMEYYVMYVRMHGDPLPWLAVELDAYRD